MKRLQLACVAFLLCLTIVPVTGQRYAARREGDIVQLTDTATDTRVSIAPGIGNIAYRMTVKGHDVLRWPHADLAAFKTNPNQTGVPFMAPWINRLDEQAFYANGKRYAFDMALGNVRGAIPIHGLVTTTSEWHVVSVDAGRMGAAVTSRLEFSRQPSWMKQWPFAHTIEMTYRLTNGTLEVETAITNLSAEPMPVSVGFHPYFQLTDSPRDEWHLAIGARTHWKLQPTKLPTGDTEPIAQFLPDPKHVAVKDVMLDDIFTDLERDASGRAMLSLSGNTQRIDVVVGPKFKTALVYTPPMNNPNRGGGPGANGAPGVPMRGSVAFEPMAAITNALNLSQKGVYKELQSIEPGGSWEESFWIRPHGF
jgi:aldose 1-epimerase